MGVKVIFKNGVSGVVSDSVYKILLKKGEINLYSPNISEDIKNKDSIKKDTSGVFLDKKVSSVKSYEIKDNFKQD
jgi:hypothetical protein